jgi:MSHA biogenesis protein MshO
LSYAAARTVTGIIIEPIRHSLETAWGTLRHSPRQDNTAAWPRGRPPARVLYNGLPMAGARALHSLRAPARAAGPSIRPLRGPLRTGFSLVELIVVIVITGIIASVVGLFITGPIQGFLDLSRRAGLVDSAQLALTRMGRDLRGALPNSVRVSGDAIELLLTADGDRYRVEGPGTAADRLQLTAADGSFNTLAALSPPDPVPPVGTPYGVRGALAIYPLQQAGANPYSLADGVMTAFGDITVTPVTHGAATEYQVSLTAGASPPGAQRFPFDSPTRRVYLVEGPVTYHCNPPQLLRYDGYGVTAIQAVPPAGTPIVIATNVRACSFRFDPGTAQRNAVVSIALSLAEDAALEERVRLIRQVQVGNAP